MKGKVYFLRFLYCKIVIVPGVLLLGGIIYPEPRTYINTQLLKIKILLKFELCKSVCVSDGNMVAVQT